VIDRRHVALGAAIGASIASQPRAGPPLLYGDQKLEAGPFTLDDSRPTRSWRITTEVELPAEAADHDVLSQTGVEALAADADSDDLATVSFGECGAEPIEELWGGLVFVVDGAFEDCGPGQNCTRTFCVDITSDEDHPVEGWWQTWTTVQSMDNVKYGDDSIPVPIEITIEEIEP